jgi:hypothetical protein
MILAATSSFLMIFALDDAISPKVLFENFVLDLVVKTAKVSGF